MKRLMTGFRNWSDSKPGVRPHGVVYALLHSLAHALMTEIALDCGYPASALKERIYALPPATPEGPLRCALLIYTATAGTQGTLGGLVEVADQSPKRSLGAGGRRVASNPHRGGGSA